MSSPLSYFSTFFLRQQLLSRNLPPYRVPGVYSGIDDRASGDLLLRNFSVINSPDPLENEPFLTNAYKINEFGPSGGFDKDISFITDTAPNSPNTGPYGPFPPFTEALLNYTTTFRTAAVVKNRFSPQGGFTNIYNISDRQVIPTNNPYWSPPSFQPSIYTPYNIILQGDPVGSDGSLSEDSQMMKNAAVFLKNNLQARVNQSIQNQTLGRLNILNGLRDPFNLAQILGGRRPLISRDWKITVGQGILGAGQEILQRFAGVTIPLSPIPGDYFDEDMNQRDSQNTFSQIAAFRDGLVGKLFGRLTAKKQSPSELFLDYTGSGQRSQLKSNLEMNRYRPSYQFTSGGNIVQSIAGAIQELLGVDDTGGDYYVGSLTSDPSIATSPPGKIPIDQFGREINSPVFGPDVLGKMYEGEDKNFKFGFAGKSYEDGGGIQGGFTWVSPKYKKDAGTYVGPGGQLFSSDPNFGIISGPLESTESTTYDYKPGSILFNTQRLIDSIPDGQSRFTHVGNAIDQTSKVFNDGYKEMTKGSRVIAYRTINGTEVGQEYCRIFTKDTPYFTYDDLQKSEGITTYGRKFADSVLDNTYNLNIVPTDNNVDRLAKEKNVRKYMFSIENLAWRTGAREGFRVQDLPECERGPNGGRVMWFPPYGLTFNEDTTPTFRDNVFLGRPEPVYTYSSTKRTGSISWKIVVDHPSVMNTLVQKVLGNETNRERVDSIIASFFAGCKKYDLYELARRYNTIPSSELFTYQQILNDPNVTQEQIQSITNTVNNNVSTVSDVGASSGGVGGGDSANGAGTYDFSKYVNLGFYFENDFPDPKTKNTTSSQPFNTLYNSYIALQPTYLQRTVQTDESKTQVTNFFNDVIEDNFNASKTLIKELYEALKNKGYEKISLTFQGSASLRASVSYNVPLSQRRINSVLQYFQNYSFTSGSETVNLSEFIQSGRLVIKEIAQGELAENVTSKSYNKNNSSYLTTNCSDNDLLLGQEPDSTTWYSITPMACRAVRVVNVDVTQGSAPTPQIEANPNRALIEAGQQPQPFKPQPQVDVLQQVKEGISKKILRRLLSECDYFEMLKQDDPMVFDSLKDKLKYFSPSFHSMTPEGLNARLTFLQQCTRPGDTIPTIGPNGEKIYNDSVNTSFGAPPVLVLRVGDFFNTKIIPTQINIKYETLDLNPEGIGVQPMIADVTLGFNFIGGSGLKEPVEKLQNALSFNFYANTEIYDERADATSDTTALDEALVKAIIDNQPLVGVNNTSNVNPIPFGDTIGDIQTRVQTETSETGTTQFNVVMDDLVSETQLYYEACLNFIEEINTNYNSGIYQSVVNSMNYTDGTFLSFVSPIQTPLFGKPGEFQTEINQVFDQMISNIENDQIQIIATNNLTGATKNSIRIFKSNYVTYINNLKSSFYDGLTGRIQDLVNTQQSYVYLIDKLNLVDSLTDAYLLQDNTPKIFNLSGTTIQTGATPSATADTYVQLANDITTVANSNGSFINDLKTSKLYGNLYNGVGEFTPYSPTFFSAIDEKLPSRIEYMLICNEVLNNYENFKSSLLVNIPQNDLQYVTGAIEDQYNDKFRESFKNEKDATEKAINDFRVTQTKYTKFTPYPLAQSRPFIFDTLPAPTSTQTTNVKNLYTVKNVDNNNKVYNLKKKFN